MMNRDGSGNTGVNSCNSEITLTLTNGSTDKWKPSNSTSTYGTSWSYGPLNTQGSVSRPTGVTFYSFKSNVKYINKLGMTISGQDADTMRMEAIGFNMPNGEILTKVELKSSIWSANNTGSSEDITLTSGYYLVSVWTNYSDNTMTKELFNKCAFWSGSVDVIGAGLFTRHNVKVNQIRTNVG